MTATMYGTRTLPPHESGLPAQVSDRIAAWRGACQDAAKAQAALAQHKRDGITSARRRDVEAAASAMEQSRPAPKPVYEQRALRKLSDLDREAEAAGLVQQRCYQRMEEAIAAHSAEITHAAERRASEAKKRYLAAVDQLEAAAEQLREATAFKVWSADPSASFKQRALRGVPIPRHSSDAPDLGSVVSALREVVEPPRRLPLPSPFGTAPVEEQGEPASAHSYEAELPAGMVSAEE